MIQKTPGKLNEIVKAMFREVSNRRAAAVSGQQLLTRSAAREDLTGTVRGLLRAQSGLGRDDCFGALFPTYFLSDMHGGSLDGLERSCASVDRP